MRSGRRNQRVVWVFDGVTTTDDHSPELESCRGVGGISDRDIDADGFADLVRP